MPAWVQLVGRLASTPERREFAGGGHYWLFYVETARPGNQERTDTWTCTWTGDGAERAKSLEQGQWVGLTGYLETYERNLGKQAVRYTAVRVLDLRPLPAGARPAGEQGPEANAAQARERGAAGRPAAAPAPEPPRRVAEGARQGRRAKAQAEARSAGALQDGAGQAAAADTEAIPMAAVDPTMFGLAGDDEEDGMRP